jgi:hypothetical protein
VARRAAEPRARFGKSGFEGVVGPVAELKKTLGIFDLSRFTPT